MKVPFFLQRFLPESHTSSDIIGVYPRAVHVAALETRRMLWTARTFAIGMCISFCLNIILVFAISMLVPLKTVEPMLVTMAHKSEQVVRIEPLQKNIKGLEIVTEQAVRNYVLQRETITHVAKEMEYRWHQDGTIARLSAPEAFFVFQKQLPDYRKAFESGIQRHVKIGSAQQIAPKYWSLEFETTDTDLHANKEIGHHTWQATLLIDFVPKKVAFEDRFMNPLGFTVLQYAVAKKG